MGTYDFVRDAIRISWHAELVPKVPLGRVVYVDGISNYLLDRETGKIIEHQITKLQINQTPVEPPYGILSLIQQDLFGGTQRARVPVGVLGSQTCSTSP